MTEPKDKSDKIQKLIKDYQLLNQRLDNVLIKIQDRKKKIRK